MRKLQSIDRCYIKQIENLKVIDAAVASDNLLIFFYGLELYSSKSKTSTSKGPWPSMDKASAFYCKGKTAGDPGFKSQRARHHFFVILVKFG
jgi:hypothetical protein